MVWRRKKIVSWTDRRSEWQCLVSEDLAESFRGGSSVRVRYATDEDLAVSQSDINPYRYGDIAEEANALDELSTSQGKDSKHFVLRLLWLTIQGFTTTGGGLGGNADDSISSNGKAPETNRIGAGAIASSKKGEVRLTRGL